MGKKKARSPDLRHGGGEGRQHAHMALAAKLARTLARHGGRACPRPHGAAAAELARPPARQAGQSSPAPSRGRGRRARPSPVRQAGRSRVLAGLHPRSTSCALTRIDGGARGRREESRVRDGGAGGRHDRQWRLAVYWRWQS